MSFKSQLSNDMNTFLNLNEFADSCTIDNVQLDCMIDSDVNQERRYNRASSFDDGLVEIDISVFFRTADFPYQLNQGTSVVFNGNHRNILSVTLNAGVTELKLEAVIS